MSRPIPDALLERYLAGDLSAEKKAELDAALAASPAEQARLDALRADSAAFLIQHPPGPLVAKAEAGRSKAPRWLGLLLAPLAAAAALLVFFSRPHEDDVTVKGDVALAVYRQDEAGTAERVEAGAALKGGDHVRFEVHAPKDGWVAVLSRDSAGHVTIYYPYAGATAARYSAAEPLLPGAVGLDDTKGPEDLWVLFSLKPFTLGSYVEVLERGGSPAFSPEVAATRSSWNKQ